jgi:Protein of Unknown function (DUF2784)
MPPAAAADLLVAVHMGFLLFVVLGGVLVLRWPFLAWVHVPAAAWGALIEFGGWVCPLTPLENHFRHLAGQAGYQGGFIQHYIVPVLYPGELTRSIQVVLGVLVIAWNGFIYYRLVRQLRARRAAA